LLLQTLLHLLPCLPPRAAVALSGFSVSLIFVLYHFFCDRIFVQFLSCIKLRTVSLFSPLYKSFLGHPMQAGAGPWSLGL
jgi:hypothetical protein